MNKKLLLLQFLACLVCISHINLLEASMTQDIEDSLRSMPELQEGFAVTGQSFEQFLQNNGVQNYPEGAGIDDILPTIQEQAIKVIDAKLLPEVFTILCSMAYTETTVEKANPNDARILQYLRDYPTHRLNFVDNGRNYYLLCQIARTGNNSVADYILKHLIIEPFKDINQVYSKKLTLLYSAVRHNAGEVVSLLSQAGADVNAVDSENQTPLQLAAILNAGEAVRSLLQFGADVNSINTNDYTPLHLAAMVNAGEAVRLLLQFGADVNSINTNNDTPLHLAARFNICKHNGDEVVPLLLQAGANVNAVNTKNQTPLHFAASSNFGKVVPLLLLAGANVNQLDNQDHTAYAYAEINSRNAFSFEDDKQQQAKKIMNMLADAAITERFGH